MLGKQGGVMELPPDAVAFSSYLALKKKLAAQNVTRVNAIISEMSRMMMQFQTGWRSHPSNKMRAETSISLHHSPIPRAWSYLNASAIITVGLPSEYPVSKEGILRPWLCTSGPSNRVVAWVVYEGPRPWTRLELVFNEHEHP